MKYYLGIDLGGTNIAAGIVDENGDIIQKYSEKTEADGVSFEALVKRIADVGKKCTALCGVNISAVGMGTPSCINPETGLLVNANNLGWQNVPLKSEMERHFNCPVYIQNDAACAALGEAFAGAAKGSQSAVMITLGTGVGGGIILDGRLFNGCDGMGAEIGHTKLVYHGEHCTCGQHGCFESYASATALIRQAKAAVEKNPDSQINKLSDKNGGITAKTVFDAAELGDETATSVVQQYISYLSAGISSLVAVFRPQTVIIGGGVSKAGDYLIKPLRQKLYEDVFAAEQIGAPDVVTATLGNDAGIIGAALLCKQ